MNAIAIERTHVMDVAAMLRAAEEAVRQAMRDRTWEPTPIGREVRSYLRVLRWQFGRLAAAVFLVVAVVLVFTDGWRRG